MKRRILSSLMALVLVFGLLPATAFAAEGAVTAVYVSSTGNDTAGDGSQSAPFATLAKAVEQAPDGATIYVMSDLTMTACARFYSKSLTITSGEGGPYTVTRGYGFDALSDPARSWYNPAMVEVQTTGGEGAGLTLTNIIFDDDGKKEGTVFAQAVSDGSVGATSNDNRVYVQDAIIASNATVPSTITLGDGAVMRNFGGESAVRVTNRAQLVMKSGSVIEDNSAVITTRGSDADNKDAAKGPAGAVWLQGGSFTMEAGAKIQNVNGRAVYADGGEVTVGGTISGITGNANMWQGKDGTAIHLRSKATCTLTATGLIEKVTGGGTIVKLSGSTYTMDADSVMECNEGTNIAARGGTNTIFMNGKITGIKNGNYNAINLQAASDAEDIIYCKIGATGNIHDNKVWYGSVYVQGNNIELHHYGKINNNSSSDKSGGIVLANNFTGAKVFMYDGAEVIGNKSDNDGAGVMVSCGTFTMNGGKISGNIATRQAGGVYVRRGGQFIMNGGEICGNKSDTIGGGISFEASDWGSWIPCVQLNAGKVSGNTMNGNSNDLAITDKEYGRIDRYLYISGDMELGNNAVYFKNDAKTVTPADDSLNIKLGNASADSKATLKTASNGNGWADPFATFWAQRGSGAELTVGGLTVDQALPVYVLALPVDATGAVSTGAAPKVYAAQKTGSTGEVKFKFNLPDVSGNGCAVALAQPTTDFGEVVITGPAKIAEASGTATYEIPYTATYTMSDSLLSMLKTAPSGVPMTFVVELDSRLTAKKDDDGNFLYAFDGAGILEVDENSITVSPDGYTIKVTCKPVANWAAAVKDKTSVVMTLSGTGVLEAAEFTAGEYLNTTGHIEGTIGSLPVMIPANVCQAGMTAQTYTVTYTDGVDGEEIFKDQVTANLKSGDKTPAFNGTPTRDGYDFDGWKPEVAATVTANATYVAQWKDHNPSSGGDPSTTYYYFAIEKIDAQDSHTLNGAKFGLYLDGKQIATATSNRSGIAMFRVYESDYRKINAKSDLYYQELTAPEGYVVDSNEVSIEKSDLATSWSKAEKDAETVQNYRGSTPDLLNGDDHFAYVVGYQDGCVHPNALITRAETATIFFRLLKNEVRDGNLRTSNTFADVPDDYWANTAISTMANLGIVQGRSTAKFDPSASITRAEFAVICARFDTGKSNGSQTFTDIKGHWAEKYIERAAELGWIKGFEDGSFRPDTYITRAQAMTMINRVLNRIPEENSDLLSSMNIWPDCNPGDWFYLAVQEATNSHNFKHKAGNYETWTSMKQGPDWTRYEN